MWSYAVPGSKGWCKSEVRYSLSMHLKSSCLSFITADLSAQMVVPMKHVSVLVPVTYLELWAWMIHVVERWIDRPRQDHTLDNCVAHEWSEMWSVTRVWMLDLCMRAWTLSLMMPLMSIRFQTKLQSEDLLRTTHSCIKLSATRIIYTHIVWTLGYIMHDETCRLHALASFWWLRNGTECIQYVQLPSFTTRRSVGDDSKDSEIGVNGSQKEFILQLKCLVDEPFV